MPVTEASAIENSYEDHVKTMFDLDSDAIFSNGMTDHARIIIVEFLLRAKDSVVIFCHDLLAEVYDHKHMTAALMTALKNGVDVCIITQRTPNAQVFMSAAEKYNADPSLSGMLKLFQSKEEGIEQIEQNFAVMDRKAYRFEPNKVEHKAEASANQPEVANQLIKNFEQILGFSYDELIA